MECGPQCRSKSDKYHWFWKARDRQYRTWNFHYGTSQIYRPIHQLAGCSLKSLGTVLDPSEAAMCKNQHSWFQQTCSQAIWECTIFDYRRLCMSWIKTKTYVSQAFAVVVASAGHTCICCRRRGAQILAQGTCWDTLCTHITYKSACTVDATITSKQASSNPPCHAL